MHIKWNIYYHFDINILFYFYLFLINIIKFLLFRGFSCFSPDCTKSFETPLVVISGFTNKRWLSDWLSPKVSKTLTKQLRSVTVWDLNKTTNTSIQYQTVTKHTITSRLGCFSLSKQIFQLVSWEIPASLAAGPKNFLTHGLQQRETTICIRQLSDEESSTSDDPLLLITRRLWPPEV